MVNTSACRRPLAGLVCATLALVACVHEEQNDEPTHIETPTPTPTAAASTPETSDIELLALLESDDATELTRVLDLAGCSRRDEGPQIERSTTFAVATQRLGCDDLNVSAALFAASDGADGLTLAAHVFDASVPELRAFTRHGGSTVEDTVGPELVEIAPPSCDADPSDELGVSCQELSLTCSTCSWAARRALLYIASAGTLTAASRLCGAGAVWVCAAAGVGTVGVGGVLCAASAWAICSGGAWYLSRLVTRSLNLDAEALGICGRLGAC